MNKEKDTNLQQKNSDIEVEQVLDKVSQMPDEQKQLTMSKLEMYSGPIPHPRYLKQYEDLDPGAAKLIIENGVEEARHRTDMKNKAIEFSRRDHKRRDYGVHNWHCCYSN